MKAPLEILKKQLTSEFLPQAYLFWGDDNETKEKAIKYIISNFLGDNFYIHPNFYEIAPEEEKGQNSISIAMVRDMRERAHNKPFDIENKKNGSKNVFLIRDLDLLRYDASSVLLKLLEEPPVSAFFLATTTNRNAILKTIRSRFLMLRFWQDSSKNKFEHINQLKKMPYFDRFKEIPKIVEKDNLSIFMREALIFTENKIRLEISQNNNIGKTTDALKRLLMAYHEITNPTINKRLLGEYCAMLL